MAAKDGALHRRCAVCRNPAQAGTAPPASPSLRSCAKTSRRAGSESLAGNHRKCRRCLRTKGGGAFGTDLGGVRFEQGVDALQSLQADAAFVCGEAAERCKASWMAEQAS